MNKHIEITGCGFYKMPQGFADKPTPLRTVTKYEIELVTLADTMSYFDGKPNRITSPCIFVARPGQTRQTRGYFECNFIHFECCDELLATEYLNKFPNVIPISDIKQYVYLLNDIIKSHTCADALGNELCVTGKLYNFIGKLTERCDANKANDGDFLKYESVISESQKYISKNFGKKLTLSKLSEAAHFSPSHYHRIFKRLSGSTPTEYILSVRITNAKLMLLTTDKSLSDIAFECGFDTQSYMNYVFKKKLGETPLEFRENNKYSVL